MKEIYFDNSATTRVDIPAANIALQIMLDDYGNPSSLHKIGTTALTALEDSRVQMANALGCAACEVVFTSGGTESNNLALQGVVNAHKRRGKTIITTAVEHASVLTTLANLPQDSFNVKIIKPNKDGTTDISGIANAVDDDTILVSAMLVNNETGCVTDIAALSHLIRRRNNRVLIHCDAVQAFGKLPFSPKKLGVDLLSISGHKIHAPKGIGALYIRKGVRITAQIFGGGQENSLRAGTQNTPFACAFGHMAEKLSADIASNHAKAVKLYEYFVNNCGNIRDVCINSPANGSPYICNISLVGYRSEILLNYLSDRGIYISSGSACASGAKSHVLTATALPHNRIDSAIRVSFCADNTIEETQQFFAVVARAMEEIRPV